MKLWLPLAVVLSILYKADFGSALSIPERRTATTTTCTSPFASDRRSLLLTPASAFVSALVLPVLATTFLAPVPAQAAPEIFTTPKGAKYAILQESKEKGRPANGDIVAIEYTGYLADGSIFDATHSQGKKNALMFEVGGNAVIPGINEGTLNALFCPLIPLSSSSLGTVVKELVVGEKVQAIIPPSLGFGDKGICLETGECLVKPGATLVYDIYLKRSAIPPP